MDKIYWLYKSVKPISRAEKKSRLEIYFQENRKQHPIHLPEHFKSEKTISGSAVGDLMTMDGLENSQNLLYKQVADIVFERDISFANLESQLTTRKRGKIVIKKNESVMINLSDKEFHSIKGHLGKTFSVMNVANNHTFDREEEGIAATLTQLEASEIEFCGINRKKADLKKARILTRCGIKIGVIGATFSLNGRALPKTKKYLVNIVAFNRLNGDIDLSLIKDQISDCRQQRCDIIIASFHWGLEHDFFPAARQVDLAHSIIELGVDVIIGHHSHVIQPIEYYRTKRDPNRIAIICYSLGNLTTPISAPYLILSEIINFSITKGVLNGQERTYVHDAAVTPVVCLETTRNNTPLVRIKKLSDFADIGELPKKTAALKKILAYAELVLGVNWRDRASHSPPAAK